MPRTRRQENIRILKALYKHSIIAYHYALNVHDNAQLSGHGEIAQELTEIMDMLDTVGLKTNHCINIINGVAH